MLNPFRPQAFVLLGPILLLAACTADSGTESSPGSIPSPTTTIDPSSTTLAQQALTTSRPGALESAGVVDGVVVDVEGTLGAVASFTIRLTDGTDATFVPAAGVLFDGSAPIDHVRDHMVSGAPVRVEYTTLGDGTLSAVGVSDA